jgi:hypothetical protein
MDKKLRKYNSEFRNNLKQKINKLTEKTDFIAIYDIIQKSNITTNRNGIYFDLNKLDDDIIEKLSIFLQGKFDINPENSQRMVYQSYSKDNLESLDGPKLSNQERNILKKIRQNP